MNIYHITYAPEDESLYLPEDVEEAVKIAKKYLLDVSCIRGDEELMFDVVRIY